MRSNRSGVWMILLALLGGAGCQQHAMSYDASQKVSALSGEEFVVREALFLSGGSIYGDYVFGMPGNWPDVPSSMEAYYASPAGDYRQISGVAGVGTRVKVQKVVEDSDATSSGLHVVGVFVTGPFEGKRVLMDPVLTKDGTVWGVNGKYLERWEE